MKKITHLQLLAMLLFSAGALRAQTNTFPTTGNVGIGTLSPASALEVVGSSKLGGASNNIAVDANGNLVFNGTAAYKVGGNRYAFQYSGNTNYGLFFSQSNVRYELRNSAATATFFVGADNGNGYFFGNLGLGVQSAAAKLDVAGTVKIADGTQGAGKVLTSDANGLASWQTSTGGGTITGTGAAGNLAFWTGATALGTNANLFWDNTNGRLGVGTASPVNKLDVSGTAGLRASSTNTGTGTTDWIAGNFGGTAGDRVVMGNLNGRATIGAHNNALGAWATLSLNQGGGNVGINTATANAQLQFSNSIANRKMVLWEDANNDNQYYGFGINASMLRYQTSGTGDHAFFAGTSSTGSTELMRIKGSGNVGIGTGTPSARLHIKDNSGSWPAQILESSSTVGTWLSIGNTSTNGKWFSLIATGSGNGGGAGRFLLTTNSSPTFTTAYAMTVDSNANVAIGQLTASTGYRLTVNGKVICTELKVQLQPFPDYVFEKNYKLRTLKEVESHIDTYKRLPGMPSAKEVESAGMNVGEMQGKVVEKVEELTLYIIQQQKQIEASQKQVEALQQLVEILQQQVAAKK